LGFGFALGFGGSFTEAADRGARGSVGRAAAPWARTGAAATGVRDMAVGRASASAARLAFISAYFFHSAMPPLIITTRMKMMSSVFLIVPSRRV
jgi:hypothetical protein